MSRSVRIRDHLAAEVERLAKEERRSLANMVEILLEQAIAMDEAGGGRIEDGDQVVGYAFPPHYVGPPTVEADPHFKPDFKK